jgi:hypothetical protein
MKVGSAGAEMKKLLVHGKNGAVANWRGRSSDADVITSSKPGVTI